MWNRRVFYDLTTGEHIITTGGFESTLSRYSVDYEFGIYKSLNERVRETVGVLDLEVGQYAQDFAECTGYRVNVTTKTLEFSYPDPNAPETEPIYQKPLTEQILQLKETQIATNRAIDETSTTQQGLLELLMDMGVI